MAFPSALPLDLEGLQQVGTVTDNCLTGFHAFQHHYIGTEFGPSAHRTEFRLFSFLYENAPGTFHLLQSALRENDGLS